MGVICSAIFHFYSLQFIPPLPKDQMSSRIYISDRQGNIQFYKFTKLCCFRIYLVLQRDPCLIEKFQNIYSNNTVGCQIQCKDTILEEVIMKPSHAKDDGINIFVPIDLSHLELREEHQSLFCTVTCPAEFGRQIMEKQTTHLIMLNIDWLICQLIVETLFNIQIINIGYMFGLSLQLVSALDVGVHSRHVINAKQATLNIQLFQESLCHQMLGEEADQRYGEHRLWASVGWGLMAAVSGFLVDMDSRDSLLANYSWAFTLMLLCWTADVIVVYRMIFCGLKDNIRNKVPVTYFGCGCPGPKQQQMTSPSYKRARIFELTAILKIVLSYF